MSGFRCFTAFASVTVHPTAMTIGRPPILTGSRATVRLVAYLSTVDSLVRLCWLAAGMPEVRGWKG